jgi:protoporphyrinogen oxidase
MSQKDLLDSTILRQTKEEIVILGAGPSSLACAMELSRKEKKALLLEKDTQVGGLAKTLVFKEGEFVFRTDLGPHRFFSKNKYLYEFIEDLLDEKWIQVNRKTRQLINGKYYDYPIKALQAFKNIGPIRATKMVLSYMRAVYVYRIRGKEIKSFEDYIVANFGYELGSFNMLNYSEKIWGITCTQVHADWAKQRIKGLSLRTAILNAVLPNKKKDGPKTLVDTFFYPQYGAGLIYETIAEKIVEKGFTLELETQPTRIVHSGNKIVSIHVTGPQGSYTVEPKTVVSSIPITQFLSLLEPAPPEEVMQAAHSLSWRDQVYLFVTLNRENVTDDNWIYIPDADITMGRISEMKNFSKDMCPEGMTSMMIEHFVNEGDAVWMMKDEELFEHTMKDVERLGLFKRDEVRKFYVIKRRHVYPVYDLVYEEHLAVIKQYLDTFENLYYIGRPGRFKYNNQDHSLEMGIMAAHGICTGTKPDYDNVGSEQEYFEEGRLNTKKTK